MPRPLRKAAPLPVAWSQRVTFCESLTGARISISFGTCPLTTPNVTVALSPNGASIAGVF